MSLDIDNNIIDDSLSIISDGRKNLENASNKQEINNDKLKLIISELKKLTQNNTIDKNSLEYINNINSLENEIINIIQDSNNIIINIDKNINFINSKISNLNNSIDQSKIFLENIKNKLLSINHDNNSASIMFNDYKSIYDKYYLKIFTLLLGLIIIFISIKKLQ